MERRALLAVVISIAILLIYQEFVLKRLYPPPSGPTTEQGPPVEPPVAEGPAESALPAPVVPAGKAPAAKAPANAATVTVETDLYRAVFTAAGGRLESLELKNYKATNQPDSPPL